MRSMIVILTAFLLIACSTTGTYPIKTADVPAVEIGIRDGQVIDFRRQVDINGNVTIETGQVHRNGDMLYSSGPDKNGNTWSMVYDIDYQTVSINGGPSIPMQVFPFQRSGAGLLEKGLSISGIGIYRMADVVVVDIKKPDVTGYSLYDPLAPELPILIDAVVTSPLKNIYHVRVKYLSLK